MNKKDIEQLKTLQKASLQKDERDLMRSRILEYTEYKPIREAVPQIKTSYRFFYKHMVGAVLVPLFIIFATGGVSIFAESALPGDVLYAVKTSFNEQVQGLFASSPQEKAQYRNSLIEKRIEEAELLAIRNGFTDDKLDIVSSNINKQASLLEQDISHLGIEDSTQATVENLKLSARLEAYNDVISVFVKYTEPTTTLDTETSALSADSQVQALSAAPAPTTSSQEELSVVTEEVATSGGEDLPPPPDIARMETESDTVLTAPIIETTSTLDGRFVGLADKKREELAQKLESIKETLSSVQGDNGLVVQEVNAQVSEIENIQKQADEKYTDENYGEAYIYYQKALRKVRDIEILVSRIKLLLLQ